MAQNTIVVRARGARGPVGSQGRDGLQGLQGLQGFVGQVGPAGSGVLILGSYNNYSDLINEHPIGSIGDAYLVAGELYVWDATHIIWQNVGAIAGVQGLQGLTGLGTQGISGLQGLAGSQGVQGVIGTGLQGLAGSQGLIGLQGLIGSTGVQGIAGVSFSTSQVSFKYEQASMSSEWTINHNLSFNPNITILDYSGNTIECDIEYVNINRVKLTFSSDASGYAYLS